MSWCLFKHNWSKWGRVLPLHHSYEAIQTRRCWDCGAVQTRKIKSEVGFAHAQNLQQINQQHNIP